MLEIGRNDVGERFAYIGNGDFAIGVPLVIALLVVTAETDTGCNGCGVVQELATLVLGAQRREPA